MYISILKTPEQIKITQQNYLRAAENRALTSLIKQFNYQIDHTTPKHNIYTLTLFVNRPAGMTDITKIRRRFLAYCIASDWTVKSLLVSADECEFIVTVTPAT
jgi:hypothetical protein